MISKNNYFAYFITYVKYLYRVAFLKDVDYLGEWSVQFIKNSISKDNISKLKFIDIKNPKDGFYADPFVHTSNNKTICFVEEYCYSSKKAVISAIELTGERYIELGRVLSEDFHMSFPYIFKDNGVIYMVPETGSINEIRLYVCKDFPMKWEYHSSLLKNISAADTMIYKKNGIYYLLTNTSSGSNSHNESLSVFYSRSFPSYNWSPLQKSPNPIKHGSDKSRNAGLFAIDNEMIRVNQITTCGTYGSYITANKIVDIGVDKYIEAPIDLLDMEFFFGCDRIHHLHSNDIYTVRDCIATK
jgi:hypothetical protein